MSNVSQFSTTAASNNSASPNGFPEGMSPAGLNDSARELMAALAKCYKDQNGTITTGGTTTAYTLTTNNSHAALTDISLFAFQVNAANTGAATLAVDGLTAKSMQLNGAALAAGDLRTNEIVLAVYNPDNDVFDIFKSGLNQDVIKTDTINEQTTASGVTVDGVLLKDNGITATGTINFSSATVSDLGAVTTADINGGTIDGTVIGGSSAAAGSFTTLSASTSITGTLATAAQTNVTSLGTLTGLTVGGNIAVTGTVDGRDVAADGTKLDGIEAGADVTDATNVDAAGATMNTDTDVSTVSWVVDEDAMTSNLATKVPTQQSVKAYVDATVVAIGALSVSGTPVANDYARFTGAATIEGRSYSEARTDLGLGTSDSPTFGGITLASGASVTEFSTDGTLAGDSDTAVPTEKAVKTYVDANAGGASVEWLEGGDMSAASYYEIDFTSYAAYAEIHIVLDNVKPSSNNNQVCLQFSNNITSWIAITVDYQYMGSTASTALAGGSSGTTPPIDGNQGVSSTYGISGRIEIINPHSTSNYMRCLTRMGFRDGSGTRKLVNTEIMNGSSEDEEGVRLVNLTGGQTLTGRVDVYGVKRS